MPRYLFIIVVWGLLITAGCEDPAQIGAGGLVVEALPAQPEPVRREAGPQPGRLENGDKSRRDRDRSVRQGWGQDRQFPSASGNWGDARELPGNDLPSDSAATSRDRRMPSDSLPSRTEKWGRDREMPSDRPNWGKDRSMPSDSAFQPRREKEPTSSEDDDSE